MFCRTSLVLARSGRGSFARFYKSVTPHLPKTKGSRRMNLAAALWTVTAPKFHKMDSPARTKEAVRLYAKHGSAILPRARVIKKRLAKQSGAQRSSVKASPRRRGKSIRQRKASSKRRTRKSKTLKGKRAGKRSSHSKKLGGKRKHTKPLATFARYRTSVTHRKLSRAELAVLDAVFRATAGLPQKTRITTGKTALSLLRRRATGKKAPKATTKAKKLARKHRKSRAHKRSRRATAKGRKNAARKTRKGRKTRKTPGARKSRAPAKVNTAYNNFRQQVMKRTGLPATKKSNIRVQRLWFLTSSQRRLNTKGRVDMAVGLIKKSKKAKHMKPAKTKKSRKSVRKHRKAASPTRKSKKPAKKSSSKAAAAKTKKSSPVRSRRHNPYLKFYREMVLTGAVPNHPPGARSRRIKQLWAGTKHLKTIPARVKLGRAYATGEIPLPSTKPGASAPATAAAAAAAVVKPGAAVAKTKVKKAAKEVRKATPPPPIRFTVPSIYNKSPFVGAYIALHEYAAGSTPAAKMHNVSEAWAKSAYPPAVVDDRTPRQRIIAAADALRRA